MPPNEPTPIAWPAMVLLLPGWQNSGPAHWQSRWESSQGFTRVEQDDWDWPRRGDWMARLDEVLLALPQDPARPVLLAAHSLGCQLVAAWAAHSTLGGRVRAALLVAPPDTERPEMPPQLHGWRPIVRARLPFESLAVLSRDDPYGSFERTRAMAADWGCRVVDAGRRGHLNSDSGLGDWPQGLAMLRSLLDGPPPPVAGPA